MQGEEGSSRGEEEKEGITPQGHLVINQTPHRARKGRVLLVSAWEQRGAKPGSDRGERHALLKCSGSHNKKGGRRNVLWINGNCAKGTHGKEVHLDEGGAFIYARRKEGDTPSLPLPGGEEKEGINYYLNIQKRREEKEGGKHNEKKRSSSSSKGGTPPFHRGREKRLFSYCRMKGRERGGCSKAIKLKGEEFTLILFPGRGINFISRKGGKSRMQR